MNKTQTDTAGNEINGFLFPCPNRCGSTAGCDKCRPRPSIGQKFFNIPVKYGNEPIEEGIGQETEERFYKEAFKMKTL